MKRTPDICVRVNEEETKIIKDNMKKFGFYTVSDYIRFVAINTTNILLTTNSKN